MQRRLNENHLKGRSDPQEYNVKSIENSLRHSQLMLPQQSTISYALIC